MNQGAKPSRREVIAGAAAVAGSMFAAGGASAAQAGSQARGPSGPFANLKVLVFDTFGTVVDWRSVIIEEGAALSKAKGFTLDWPAFADEWRGAYGPSMNRVRTGELPWTKLDVLHRMSLDTLLAKHQITQLSEADKAQLNRVWHRGRPWPDSVAGLTRLKTRFTIAPLSNGNISLLTNMAKRGKLPWDCILGAELVRHYKPDPETYMSPVEFFDLTPPEVMMVAAHVPDLQVPKRLGLRTAYIHRPYERGSARAGEMPASGTFDFIVKDLQALATALGV
jgi:2-haloacid dehalogenase